MKKKISISPQAIAKYNLSEDAIFTLLNIYYNGSIEKGLQELIDKNYASPLYDRGEQSKTKFFLLDEGRALIEDIILESESEEDKEDDINILADSMRAIFPSGKKQGTNYYWKDNTASIVKKLKIFFRRYGDYPQESIIEATQKYVDSFNGVYTYMQLLKYFIWKNKSDGSEDSELLTYLENMGQEEDESTLPMDWTTTLI